MLFAPLWMQLIILALLHLNWRTCLNNKCLTYQLWRQEFHVWARCIFFGEMVIIFNNCNRLSGVCWCCYLFSNRWRAMLMWIKKAITSINCLQELWGIISITLCQVCSRDVMFTCSFWVMRTNMLSLILNFFPNGQVRSSWKKCEKQYAIATEKRCKCFSSKNQFSDLKYVIVHLKPLQFWIILVILWMLLSNDHYQFCWLRKICIENSFLAFSYRS